MGVTLLAGCRIRFAALFAFLHANLLVEDPNMLGFGVVGTLWAVS